MAGASRVGHARGAAGDGISGSVEFEHEGLAVDVQTGERREVRQPLRRVAEHGDVGNLGGHLLANALGEGIGSVRVGGARTLRPLQAARGCHGQGDAHRAGIADPAAVSRGSLPPSAWLHRDDTQSGRSSPRAGVGDQEVPCGRGVGAAEGHGGVDEDGHPGLLGGDHGLAGLQGADLVIGGLQARQGGTPQGVLPRVAVDPAPSVHPDGADLPARDLVRVGGLQHGTVLDGGHHQGARASGQGPVDGLAQSHRPCPREGQIRRPRADLPGDGLPGRVKEQGGPAGLAVEAAGIGPAGIGGHGEGLPGCGVERLAGGSIQEARGRGCRHAATVPARPPGAGDHSRAGRGRCANVADVGGRGFRRGTLVVLALAGAAVLLSGCTANEAFFFDLPDPATAEGPIIKNLWDGSWIAAWAVGIVTWGLMLWAAFAYRRRKASDVPDQTKYNIPIELMYTVVPLIMILGLFFFTARDQTALLTVENDQDQTVNVVGFRWSWAFNYLDEDVYAVGTPDELPVLVLPVDEKVKFELTSPDVIHSFWVPDWLFKMDVIPGKVNTFEITPNKLGTFAGRCAELCGTDHARMLFTTKIVSREEFDAYIAGLRAAGQTGMLESERVSYEGERPSERIVL